MKYKQSVYKTFALISQLGISILVPILLCTFFGTWGRMKKLSFFHTPLVLLFFGTMLFSQPLFIPLVIVGVLAGLRNAWVLARHANEDPEDKNKN